MAQRIVAETVVRKSGFCSLKSHLELPLENDECDEDKRADADCKRG
jgi:hypothetical protein